MIWTMVLLLFGQLTLFCRRAVAQKCHGPHMKGLVSIGGAQQGNISITPVQLQNLTSSNT